MSRILKDQEIIRQANYFRDEFDLEPVTNVLGACEEFYMNGMDDDHDGDVETFGHFYRVHRWIVHTDNQGFKELDTYDDEYEATKAFEKLSEEYAATFDTDECF